MNTSNRSSHKDDSVANSSISSDVNLSSVIDRSVLQYIDQPHRSNTNLSNLRTDHNYKGFDATLGKSWIYPTNYQIRQYQYNISRVALFKNTLVKKSRLTTGWIVFYFIFSPVTLFRLFCRPGWVKPSSLLSLCTTYSDGIQKVKLFSWRRHDHWSHNK